MCLCDQDRASLFLFVQLLSWCMPDHVFHIASDLDDSTGLRHEVSWCAKNLHNKSAAPSAAAGLLLSY